LPPALPVFFSSPVANPKQGLRDLKARRDPRAPPVLLALPARPDRKVLAGRRVPPAPLVKPGPLARQVLLARRALRVRLEWRAPPA
jgi:hypothetical protein